MYKNIVFLLCGVLLFTMVSSSIMIPASANDMVPLEIDHEFKDEYKVEVLEDTDKYQKIKFTNIATGEVEYLEMDLSGDTPEYLAIFNDEETNQEMKVLTYKDDNEIVTHNLTTNEVEKDELQGQLEFNSKDKDMISPMYIPGESGEYVLRATFNGKKVITDAMAGNISLIAGIVAAIYYGPIAGIATTIALSIMTAGAPSFYYKHELYFWRDSPNYPAYYVKYYKNSNHTGYFGSAWNTTR